LRSFFFATTTDHITRREEVDHDATSFMISFTSRLSRGLFLAVFCLLIQEGELFAPHRAFASRAPSLLKTSTDESVNSNVQKEVYVEQASLTTVVLRISYDGGRFSGWSAANDPKEQVEKWLDTDDTTAVEFPPLLLNTGRKRRRRALKAAGGGAVRSVQGVVQSNLAKIYGNIDPERIVVEGCSRTDKGVHARSMIAQIYCLSDNKDYSQADSSIPGKRLPHPRNATDDAFFEPLPMTLSKLSFCLNRMLPADIRVLAIAPTPDALSAGSDLPFHPTLSSISKTYCYTLSTGPFHDPTQYRRVWHTGDSLCLDKIREACTVLQGRHDFASFQGAARGSDDKRRRLDQNSVCHLSHVSITHTSSWLQTNTYTVTVTGDRFLYKMVRFLVGALVAVGRDQLTTEDIVHVLESGSRGNMTWECAPSHGLMLHDVHYDDHIDWLVAQS
jgi:tRNA pseudouridine38-40 synthase